MTAVDSSITVAVVVAASTVVGPLLVVLLTGLLRRNERAGDREREDQRDAKVAKKLDVIHTLVDGTMTAALRAEFEATQRELTLMQEVVDLRKAQGHDPSKETLATIEATRAHVAELRTTLGDRLKAVAAAEGQEAADSLGRP